MQLALIGISHHQTPIDVREKISCSDRTLPAALSDLATCEGVREAAILSTCNRMEIYALLDDLPGDRAFAVLQSHIARHHRVDERLIIPYLYQKRDQEAVTHLLRVASGLDSLVLGEAQILGQVRQALRSALDARASAGILEKLFNKAIETGKRVQSETGLGRGGFSIGHAAVDLAARIFDDVSRAHVLILGAGKMSELTAKHLVRQGVQFVVVANRTYERAVVMAERLGGKAIQFEEAFRTELAHADIVIASTASPHPILRRENLLPVLKQRRGKPLFLIDIAVPRDIDPDVNELNNVFLYNIDDLQNYVAEYAGARASEAHRAESLVAEEATRFITWYRSREAAPVITALNLHLDQIRQDYLDIFSGRLAHLADRDRRTIEAMAAAMMDQVARGPILRLKHAANHSASGSDARAYDLMSAACEIFDLQSGTERRESHRRPESGGPGAAQIARQDYDSGFDPGHKDDSANSAVHSGSPVHSHPLVHSHAPEQWAITDIEAAS